MGTIASLLEFCDSSVCTFGKNGVGGWRERQQGMLGLVQETGRRSHQEQKHNRLCYEAGALDWYYFFVSKLKSSRSFFKTLADQAKERQCSRPRQ